MSFILNFEAVSDHSKIVKDGVIYTKISSSLLDNPTTSLLIISEGVVVEQTVIVPGDIMPDNFIGMTTVELADWSNSPDDIGFETREIDLNLHNNNKTLEV